MSEGLIDNSKTDVNSTPITNASQIENMETNCTPLGDTIDVKKRKLSPKGCKATTPSRSNIQKAPELTPQSQVQLRAKTGRHPRMDKFKTMSLKSFTSFKQVCFYYSKVTF